MIKKRIKYTDFNGVEREEDFYFNISKAELVEMESSRANGFAEYLKRIVEKEDVGSIVGEFKAIILLAYGEKSDDGKRFIKSEELSKAFSETNAFSELFITLASDTEVAATFINGVMPSDMRDGDKEITVSSPFSAPPQANT